MKTVVTYDSRFGNTERLAEVIAQHLAADALGLRLERPRQRWSSVTGIS